MHGSRRGRREVTRFPRCLHLSLKHAVTMRNPLKVNKAGSTICLICLNLVISTTPHKCPSHVSTGYLRAVSLWITLKLSNFAHCILQSNDRSILNTLTTILILYLGLHIFHGSCPLLHVETIMDTANSLGASGSSGGSYFEINSQVFRRQLGGFFGIPCYTVPFI